MPFRIPNQADAGTAAQSAIDSVDFDIIAAALNGRGVVSGCAPTAQGTPDMTVAIAVGVVVVDGVRVAVAGANGTISTADTTNPRFDLISINSSGTIVVTAGTAAARPVFPAVPANSAALATVHVPANDTAIQTAQIVDKRMIVGDVAAAGVQDDILIRLGSDGDAALALSSSAVAADAEVTNLIEGTSDHLGHAANSLVIANITDNGDIHLLASKGGNSFTGLLIDGSAGDTILNAASGGSVDVYIAGVKEIDYATGAMAFQQATIISISSGNLTLSPTSGELIVTENIRVQPSDNLGIISVIGTGSQELRAEATSDGNDGLVKMVVSAGSSGSPRMDWIEGSGDGSANNMSYTMAYATTPAYLYLRSQDTDGASADADIWRVSDSQLSIDANTTWDANIFDDYDDALMLSPYREGVFSLARRKQDLIDMGVLRQYDDGFVGYNDQRMAALLAGGIYQNRSKLDELDGRLALLEKK
jgi:hypothetical protein